MILMPRIDPDEEVLRRLDEWQQQVDGEPGYQERVVRAEREWPQRNTRSNSTFHEIKALLTQMCCGGRRCMYCEDSLAHEIEHIWPKSLYPEHVFSWLNFLYACGACNRVKKNDFAVFVQAQGASRPMRVGRPRGAPVTPPPSGAPVFIDPRHEDPMAFLRLDLHNTFRLVPAPDLSPLDRERAEYTRRVLPLNSDPLVKQRRDAYGHYRARLSEYIQRRNQGASPARLRPMRQALLRLAHPTVWREMQRQHMLLPELGTLFSTAPEALDWK